MTCYAPVSAYRARKLNPSGRRSLVTDPRLAYDDLVIKIPCGECLGCLKHRAFEWRTRCVHEARLYSHNVFVTLTYHDQYLPAHASLRKEHVSSFMKRLRFQKGNGIRFFACGEYGETYHRPHYHLLLFNTDFLDKLWYKNARSGEPLYESYQLSQLWRYGHSDIGTVTPQSCAYVAGYLCKSFLQPEFYVNREPEFRLMSRRPGLGRLWFDRYGAESYRHDNCIIDGKECFLPRYYDNLYKELDGDHYEVVKQRRYEKTLTPEAKEDATLIRRLMRERRDLLDVKRLQGEM